MGGTLGAPGTVCDGATGACVAPPPSAGGCCQSPGGVAGLCAGGPGVDAQACVLSGGLDFPFNALCQTDGTCALVAP